MALLYRAAKPQKDKWLSVVGKTGKQPTEIGVSNCPLATLLSGGNMLEFDHRLNAAWWALRIGLGVGPIVTGIDKYFNKLTHWTMYLSPLATKVVPVSAATFMHIVAVVEIIAELVVRSRSTKLGRHIVALCLLVIALNFLS